MELKSTVLVVDDEPLLLAVVSALLADEGYQVWQARDGAEALARVLATPPDLILADMRMPGLDGVALITALRARGVRVPVVLMSAHLTRLESSDEAFVAKPFDLDHVLTVVERALNPR